MTEEDFNVLRCNSLDELASRVNDYVDRGWKPIGATEVLGGKFVQAVKITFDVDDTEQITQVMFK